MPANAEPDYDLLGNADGMRANSETHTSIANRIFETDSLGTLVSFYIPARRVDL